MVEVFEAEPLSGAERCVRLVLPIRDALGVTEEPSVAGSNLGSLEAWLSDSDLVEYRAALLAAERSTHLRDDGLKGFQAGDEALKTVELEIRALGAAVLHEAIEAYFERTRRWRNREGDVVEKPAWEYLSARITAYRQAEGKYFGGNPPRLWWPMRSNFSAWVDAYVRKERKKAYQGTEDERRRREQALGADNNVGGDGTSERYRATKLATESEPLRTNQSFDFEPFAEVLDCLGDIVDELVTASFDTDDVLSPDHRARARGRVERDHRIRIGVSSYLNFMVDELLAFGGVDPNNEPPLILSPGPEDERMPADGDYWAESLQGLMIDHSAVDNALWDCILDGDSHQVAPLHETMNESQQNRYRKYAIADAVHVAHRVLTVAIDRLIAELDDEAHLVSGLIDVLRHQLMLIQVKDLFPSLVEGVNERSSPVERARGRGIWADELIPWVGGALQTPAATWIERELRQQLIEVLCVTVDQLDQPFPTSNEPRRERARKSIQSSSTSPGNRENAETLLAYGEALEEMLARFVSDDELTPVVGHTDEQNEEGASR